MKKSQTILRAPYDGFIQNRFVDEGTVINEVNPILEILDANKVEAHVSFLKISLLILKFQMTMLLR